MRAPSHKSIAISRRGEKICQHTALALRLASTASLTYRPARQMPWYGAILLCEQELVGFPSLRRGEEGGGGGAFLLGRDQITAANVDLK